MGWGDQLMAAGEARHVHQATSRKVVITNNAGAAQWSVLWEGLPYILRTSEPNCARVISASGQRPYILGKFPHRWRWKAYTPRPAEIAFTADEIAFARPYHGMVMIEPNVKAIGHRNKAWLGAYWHSLLEQLQDVRTVQCLAPGSQPLNAISTHVITPTFRHALAVLSVCRALVTTEGGLMHGAAAVGVPAVVIFGEFISPEVTGYAMHRNLYTGTGLGCGSRLQCKSCRSAMERIKPADVLANLKEILT